MFLATPYYQQTLFSLIYSYDQTELSAVPIKEQMLRMRKHRVSILYLSGIIIEVNSKNNENQFYLFIYL